MSKVMTFAGAVAANTTNQSIFAGRLHEFCSGNSAIKISATASAVGLMVSALVGNETFAQDQEILRIAPTGVGPVNIDDDFVTAAGMQGERIVVSLRNSTGGSITAQVRAEIINV